MAPTFPTLQCALCILIVLSINMMAMVHGQVQVHGRYRRSGSTKIKTFDSVDMSHFANVPTYSLPAMSNAQILADEMAEEWHNVNLSTDSHPLSKSTDGSDGSLAQLPRVKPGFIGKAVPFELDIRKDGEWTMNAEGSAHVWRAVIESKGALSISINFDSFYLPPNSELYFIGETDVIGAFTAATNNKEDQEFSFFPLPGERVVIEYWQDVGLEKTPSADRPVSEADVEIEVEDDRQNPIHQDEVFSWSSPFPSDPVSLHISSVVHGVVDVSAVMAQIPSISVFKGTCNDGDSQDCNVDVACAEGNHVRSQINSVGLFITDKGQRFCSGTVLNNGAQNGRQLFMTANHCLFADTTNFVVAFNHQNRNCASFRHPARHWKSEEEASRVNQAFRRRHEASMSDPNLVFTEDNYESLCESVNANYDDFGQSDPEACSDCNVSAGQHQSSDNDKEDFLKVEEQLRFGNWKPKTAEAPAWMLERSGLQTVHGMRLLVKSPNSDVALMEILEHIPDHYHVFFAGWDREQKLHSRVTGIHHPRGDLKKISLYNGRLYYGSWSEGPAIMHLIVPFWDVGVTERGSSGSGLFSLEGHLIGHLHGGRSNCPPGNGWDSYGALYADWPLVKHILDPQNLNILKMGGTYFRSLPMAKSFAKRLDKSGKWNWIERPAAFEVESPTEQV